MGNPIAVDGCELEDVTGSGTVTITSSPSSDDDVSGKGIFFGPVTFSISGSNGGGSISDNNGTGTGIITGTGANICDAVGQPSLLEGDTVTAFVSGTADDGDVTVPNVPVTIKVKKAGQSDVIAL